MVDQVGDVVPLEELGELPVALSDHDSWNTQNKQVHQILSSESSERRAVNSHFQTKRTSHEL